MSELTLILFLLLVYVYFGYFALTLLIGSLVGRFKKEKRYNDLSELPSMTLMIAAYNEEKDIKEKIENSLALEYPEGKLKIMVVSDASSDRTDDIVLQYKAKGVELRRVEGRVGKTEARNVAMRDVKTELVLFSDATTDYSPDLAIELARRFKDPKVGMATGRLEYRPIKGSSTGLGQKLFWKYESALKKAQSSLGTLTGSVGCATAFRRDAYTELPANIIEDFTEPLMMVLKGHRVVYEDKARCSEVTTSKASQELNMRIRVIRGGITGLIFAKKVLNPLKYPLASFQLISHKALRWLVPYIAIALFIVNFGALLQDDAEAFTAVLFMGQLTFYGLVASVHVYTDVPKLLLIPYYLYIVNVAAFKAVILSITSELETTWETERSAI